MASAAFRLEPSGPPAACAFPKCVLDAFHDGNHQLAQPAPRPRSQPVHHCVVCGRGFIIYGDPAHPIPRTCGSQLCVQHLARHDAAPIPMLCGCPQRPYRHEIALHAQLRPESYNPQLRFRYPWTLCLSPRIEPSAEGRS